jgi:uncharacterized membrane protein YedE/YeeE
MKSLAGLLCGLLFGLGLAVSGMTDTNRVLGFLDLFGDWQPALLLVMGSAVAVTLIGFRLVLRSPKPFFELSFYLPQTRDINGQLLAGAGLFGIGWGVYGYCPGPAVSALLYGERDTLLFVVAMIVGMWLAATFERIRG